VREAPSLVLGSLPVTWAVTNQVEALDDIQANLANPLEMGALERQTDRRGEFYARVSDALALYGVPRGLAQAAADPNDYTALPRACAEEAAQRTRLVDVARGKVHQEDVRVVIMGHTHEACHEDLGEGRAYLIGCATLQARTIRPGGGSTASPRPTPRSASSPMCASTMARTACRRPRCRPTRRLSSGAAC